MKKLLCCLLVLVLALSTCALGSWSRQLFSVQVPVCRVSSTYQWTGRWPGPWAFRLRNTAAAFWTSRPGSRRPRHGEELRGRYKKSPAPAGRQGSGACGILKKSEKKRPAPRRHAQ